MIGSKFDLHPDDTLEDNLMISAEESAKAYRQAANELALRGRVQEAHQLLAEAELIEPETGFVARPALPSKDTPNDEIDHRGGMGGNALFDEENPGKDLPPPRLAAQNMSVVARDGTVFAGTLGRGEDAPSAETMEAHFLKTVLKNLGPEAIKRVLGAKAERLAGKGVAKPSYGPAPGDVVRF